MPNTPCDSCRYHGYKDKCAQREIYEKMGIDLKGKSCPGYKEAMSV